MVSNQFFKIKRSWRSRREREVQPFSLEPFLWWQSVLQTARRILDVHETFILSVANILGEGRRAGAKGFYITGDINVELGSLCTDEDDIGEFNEMCRPLCWQECENDHSGFNKLMWYGIVKGFNCKVTPRGPSATRREKLLSHADNLEKKERQEGAVGLHHRAKVEVGRGVPLQWRQNMGLVGSSFDLRYDTRGWSIELFHCVEKKKEMDWMEAKRRWSKDWIPESCDAEGRRKARRKPGNNREGDRGGSSQSGTQHKNMREKAVQETPENVRVREEAAARCTKVIKRRVLKNQARKARADHLVKYSWMPGRRKVNRKPLSELYVNELHGRQRRIEKRTTQALRRCVHWSRWNKGSAIEKNWIFETERWLALSRRRKGRRDHSWPGASGQGQRTWT